MTTTIEVSRLENGMRVATVEMPAMRSVSLGLWFGVGSRHEPVEMNGACHFIEHLLFKGTRRRSARAISQAVEGVGGYLNAFTSEELTCIHARAGHDRLEQMLDVLMDMVGHSRFSPADIRKEREVIKEEMAMYLDEPQHQVQELLNATLWPDQPLGRPITGTNQTLDRMDRAELLGYLRSNYVSGGAVLVASGRVRHRQVLRLAGSYSGQVSRGPRPRFLPARDGQDGPRIRLVTRNTEQAQMALGIRTCSRQDPRRFALRLLNTILGENMSSRLFQVVREDRGLAYSIYSTPSFFTDTGDIVISAGLDPGNLTRALELIARELRRLRVLPVGRNELGRARDYVIGQMDLALESAESQMHAVGEQLLGYDRVWHPAHIKSLLSRVAPADIQSVARDFFRPERVNLAVVSPLKDERRLQRALNLS